jgi:hypothetical protein
MRRKRDIRYNLPSAETVAEVFIMVLKEQLSPEEIQEVIRLNAAETDENVCHSHDFCDANMVMAEALKRLGVEARASSETSTRLWNEGWNLAVKLLPAAYGLNPAFDVWNLNIRVSISTADGLDKEGIHERVSDALDAFAEELENDGCRPHSCSGRIRLLDDDTEVEKA